MQLKFGSYSWPVNGVKVGQRRKLVRGNNGLPWKFYDTIEADGYLEGTTQAGLTTATFTMQTALQRNFQDLILYCDDGSESATLLTNRDSITGVIVTDGPNFTDTQGPEYVNQRHFQFTAEADYVYRGVGTNWILDWSEVVNITGGGPLYSCKPALFGPPQRQMIYQQTPCVATQSGFAVGAFGYPPAVPPIWPFALKQAGDFKRTAPRKYGRAGYTEFRIEWSYTYEWPALLFGFPTPWPK
jgi:hypothetical protein